MAYPQAVGERGRFTQPLNSGSSGVGGRGLALESGLGDLSKAPDFPPESLGANVLNFALREIRSPATF